MPPNRHQSLTVFGILPVPFRGRTANSRQHVDRIRWEIQHQLFYDPAVRESKEIDTISAFTPSIMTRPTAYFVDMDWDQ